MSILQSKKGSLIETNITGKTVTDINPSTKPEPNTNKIKEEPKKKISFLKSVWIELKKSEWPTAGYVFKWGITVILFTLIFASFLGIFDNIFNSGIKFIQCTSPQGSSDSVQKCTPDLIKNLTFQG
jgi:preprotein translocase SecE subunit